MPSDKALSVRMGLAKTTKRTISIIEPSPKKKRSKSLRMVALVKERHLEVDHLVRKGISRTECLIKIKSPRLRMTDQLTHTKGTKISRTAPVEAVGQQIHLTTIPLSPVHSIKTKGLIAQAKRMTSFQIQVEL
jgi:hypothetical protein